MGAPRGHVGSCANYPTRQGCIHSEQPKRKSCAACASTYLPNVDEEPLASHISSSVDFARVAAPLPIEMDRRFPWSRLFSPSQRETVQLHRAGATTSCSLTYARGEERRLLCPSTPQSFQRPSAVLSSLETIIYTPSCFVSFRSLSTNYLSLPKFNMHRVKNNNHY